MAFFSSIFGYFCRPTHTDETQPDIEETVAYSTHKNIERPAEIWEEVLQSFENAKDTIKTREDVDKFTPLKI